MTNVYNDKALIISKEENETNEQEEKEKICISTYNYQTNELSCYRTKYNLNVTEKNICSSIYSSIVVIVNPNEDDVLYIYFDNYSKYRL